MMISTKLKSDDTSMIFAKNSTGVTLSFTSFGLILLPIEIGVSSGLTITNKIFYKLATQKKIEKFFLLEYNKLLAILVNCNEKFFQIKNLTIKSKNFCVSFQRNFVVESRIDFVIF